MGNMICKTINFFSQITPDTLVQIGLLIVASLALGTWRKQLHGGNVYQTAFDLALRVRQLEKKIQKELRNPLLVPTNGKNYNDWNWEREVYQERFRDFYQFKDTFYDVAILKAKIQFGSEIANLLQSIEDLVIEIRMAYECAYKIYRGRNEYDDERVYIQHQKKIEENREKLWNQKEDEYSKRLETAITELEKFLYKKMGK
jgi:hypothetical protein